MIKRLSSASEENLIESNYTLNKLFYRENINPNNIENIQRYMSQYTYTNMSKLGTLFHTT